MRRALLAAVVAALGLAGSAAAFAPSDPLAAKQWYLLDDHAFDAWPTPPTTLQPVKVAVVDSGIDCSLPDFQGRIADARSFVGGDPCTDTEGHGTFVAGIIAANLDTQGIVGIAYTSQLLVAKVVRSDGTIPLQAEADAIHWAVDSGARVINLSLGGVRDPIHPEHDTYSPLEASAVAYAYSKGALVVAAVGNADEAYSQPWPYASYPAALPHVLGVSALTRTGNVPDYSNRDAIYNDISAPGSGIFSTLPLALTAQNPMCVDQGYSDCGSSDYRNAEGTSFAAPQVSAAAAVLFALDPTLTASQAEAILEHSADDVNAATGCPRCAVGRDPYSGWGRLDVARAVAALALPLPAADRYEANDNAGADAYTAWGKDVTLKATLDYYDDPVDVYRVALGPGEHLAAKIVPSWPGARVALTLWKPGTTHVDTAQSRSLRVVQSATPATVQHIAFTAKGRGWYYVEVHVTTPGSGPYTLTLAKTMAALAPLRGGA
jgi:subtilisin family serine protease